jgi:mannose-6-phosphate isomerase-like protein (cupin superfamily)
MTSEHKPAKVMSLSEIEGYPGPDSLTWHPVRATLGIRAFGCNAYTASRVGDDVVEPHTEAPATAEERAKPELMHEELYFVATGRATFTIDGETHDAPAGTYVFIPDPDSHRHAVAAEEETTVLSFGGPPTFKPSEWEYDWRAECEPQNAREILQEGLMMYPGSPRLSKSLAELGSSND